MEPRTTGLGPWQGKPRTGPASDSLEDRGTDAWGGGRSLVASLSLLWVQTDAGVPVGQRGSELGAEPSKGTALRPQSRDGGSGERTFRDGESSWEPNLRAGTGGLAQGAECPPRAEEKMRVLGAPVRAPQHPHERHCKCFREGPPPRRPPSHCPQPCGCPRSPQGGPEVPPPEAVWSGEAVPARALPPLLRPRHTAPLPDVFPLGGSCLSCPEGASDATPWVGPGQWVRQSCSPLRVGGL